MFNQSRHFPTSMMCVTSLTLQFNSFVLEIYGLSYLQLLFLTLHFTILTRKIQKQYKKCTNNEIWNFCIWKKPKNPKVSANTYCMRLNLWYSNFVDEPIAFGYDFGTWQVLAKKNISCNLVFQIEVWSENIYWGEKKVCFSCDLSFKKEAFSLQKLCE